MFIQLKLLNGLFDCQDMCSDSPNRKKPLTGFRTQNRGGPSEDLNSVAALICVMPTHMWKGVIWTNKLRCTPQGCQHLKKMVKDTSVRDDYIKKQYEITVKC